MIVTIVISFAVLAIAVTFMRGPAAAFNWVFMPVFLLTPFNVWLELPGIPDINVRRAVLLSILLGAFVRRKSELTVHRGSNVDKLVFSAILVFSISYSTQTDLMGFVHQFASLGLDWWVPYFLARRLWKTRLDLETALLPISLATLILSAIAVFEARMVTRGYAMFWDQLANTGFRPYFEYFRWGYLRAAATFTHPISLGVTLATLTPLILLRRVLSDHRRNLTIPIAFACLFGTIATLSRGPILSVFLGLAGAWLLRSQRRLVYVFMGLAVAIILPTVLDMLQDSVSYIDDSLSRIGNVESGYYRIALFMIYLNDIWAAGLFGDPSLIGSEFEAAWSIDNAYLFMFLTYGWAGGSIFLALVVTQLFMVVSYTRKMSGVERTRGALFCGAVFALALAMVNVWFSTDYAPLFFILFGLVVNRSRIESNPRDPSVKV